jgi:hypothetical protein
MKRISFVVLAVVLSSCASQWKIQGGPKECISMCKGWNLDFAGMVGVGNQDATGPGATACVCQVGRESASASRSDGAGSSAASLAAPITAAEAAVAAQQAAQQQQLQMQQRLAAH